MGSVDTIAIDIHCHMLVPQARELVALYFKPALDEFLRWGGERSSAYNDTAFAELDPS